MNVYEEICQRIIPHLPEAGTNISEFTFLKQDQLWQGETEEQPFVAVAEDRWPGGGGVFLAVTAAGPVYLADLDDNHFIQYCTAGFSQFMEIMKHYQTVLETLESPDVWDDEGFQLCEEKEAVFRQEIDRIDATAIEDMESFWSMLAEEIGAGF